MNEQTPPTIPETKEAVERSYAPIHDPKSTKLYSITGLEITINQATLLEVEYYCAHYQIELDEFLEIVLEFACLVFKAASVVPKEGTFRERFYSLATGIPEAVKSMQEAYATIEDQMIKLKGVQLELQAHMPKDQWPNPDEKFGVFHKEQTPRTTIYKDEKMWSGFYAQAKRYDHVLRRVKPSDWPRAQVLKRGNVTIKFNNAVLDSFKAYLGDQELIHRAVLDALKTVIVLLKLGPQHRTDDLKRDLVKIMLASRKLASRIVSLSSLALMNADQFEVMHRIFQTYGVILQRKISAGRTVHNEPASVFARLSQTRDDGSIYQKLQNLPTYLD